MQQSRAAIPLPADPRPSVADLLRAADAAIVEGDPHRARRWLAAALAMVDVDDTDESGQAQG